jgi:hypothetical protein
VLFVLLVIGKEQLSLEFASRNVKAELLSLIEECVLEAVRA